LVTIPAAVRFLSVEPMLEEIDLSPWLRELDWLIVGGESGVGNRSRPMHPDWVRGLRDQVWGSGGAFFLKQVGSNRILWPGVKHRKGENPIEWPPDLQIQQFPRRSELRL
jgi:protein gp37